MESNLNELSINFLIYWNETAKPLAEKCVNKDIWDYAYGIERQGKNVNENDPNHILMTKLGDFNALWYIGWLIRDVENCKMRGMRLDLINSLGSMNVLKHSNTSYWTNVWKNNFSSEEAKNLREFGSCIEELGSKL